MSLLNLPTEVLTDIARLTGWSPSFQRTCKQIFQCYGGTVYESERTLERFYKECERVWPVVPESDLCEVHIDARPAHDTPTDSLITLRSQTCAFDRTECFILRNPPADMMILAMRLQCPESEWISDVYRVRFVIHTQGTSWVMGIMDGEFLHATSKTSKDDKQSTEIFKGFLPIFPGRWHENWSLAIHLDWTHRDIPHPTVSLELSLALSRLDISSDAPMCVRCSPLVNFTRTPLAPNGWALRFPEEHISAGIAELIFVVPPTADPNFIVIDPRRLGKKYRTHFPYALHPESWIIIPPCPRGRFYYFHQALGNLDLYSFFRVLYRMVDGDYHRLPREDIYFLENALYMYSDRTYYHRYRP